MPSRLMPRSLIAFISIQVAFKASHISEVMVPRTVRAFSRADCRLL